MAGSARLRKFSAPSIKLPSLSTKKGVLALSIEGPSLRLLRSVDRQIMSWATLPFNPRLVRDGRIEDPASLAEVIKNGLARLDSSEGKLVAAFPSTRLTIRVVSLPQVKGLRPEVVLPREARRLLGPMADQHIPFWVPLPGSQLERRYYLLTVPRLEMARFLEAIRLSGLKPHKVDAWPLALARAVSMPTCVLLRVEPYDLDVTVVRDHIPFIMTHRALEFGLSPEDLVVEIADAVRTTVGFYNSRYEAGGVDQETALLLVGGHPQIDQLLARAIREAVEQPVAIPPSPLDAGEDFPATEYMVPLGLALKPL